MAAAARKLDGEAGMPPLEISHKIALFVLATRGPQRNHLPLSTFRNVTLQRDEFSARIGSSRLTLTLFNRVGFSAHQNGIVVGTLVGGGP